ncbi:putative Protein tyrosine phosphatase type IVA 2-like protein [Naja naja]|nr:putative Protein tyrosine phosphatase type IVA 2-like protein [Naja naja]
MNRPAPVEITYETMRFLITHNPTNATLTKFTEVRGVSIYGVLKLVKVLRDGEMERRKKKAYQKKKKELKKYGVTTLVRVCDATYDKAPVEKEGIQVLVYDQSKF